MIGSHGVRRIATTMAATAVAAVLVCCARSSCAQESRAAPSPAADIPARFSRQVAPNPGTYWRPPDLRDYTRVLKSTDAPLIDAERRYELPELIDLAQRVNPETRVAWEAARRAALAGGLVESEYFPVLAISALGGYKSVGVPDPQEPRLRRLLPVRPGSGGPDSESAMAAPRLRSPGSAHDAAKERLLAANLGFNRKHQQIAFAVQRAFYSLTSIRARIAVAQSALDAARAVQDATERRLQTGLGTRPELALARQQAAQAFFELQEVVDKERDAQVTLAESIGIPPTAPIQVTDFSALPAPAELQDSVEKTIDLALKKTTGPRRTGRGAPRLRGGSPSGPCRLLANAVTGRRRRVHPGQGAHHRGREVHRLVRGDAAQLWHRPRARMGGLRRRSASAPGRARGIGPPRRAGRDHGDARPRHRRGLEGVHGRQAGVSASRCRRRPRRGVTGIV